MSVQAVSEWLKRSSRALLVLLAVLAFGTGSAQDDLEREGYFEAEYGVLLSGSSEDPEALKTRRGKIGGFVNYLCAEDIDFLVSTDLVADEAEPELGEGFDHAGHRAKIAAFVEDPDQDA